MAKKDEFPLVMWVIPCFDKRRENPLPVYNRTFFLDWASLSSNEQADVRAILSDKPSESKHSPAGFDTAVVTISRQQEPADWRMLKFRQHFFEPSEEERNERFQQAQSAFEDVKTVRLNAEYFEDETGQAISDYEMIQHVSGQEHPIIVGDYTSVTRLGPVAPKRVGEWTQQKADMIAHFLDVVRRIASSSWHSNPQSITYLMPERSRGEEASADSTLLEALFPNDEQTMAVLGYFRQLHAGDKLLVNACGAYIAHCGDERKVRWIDERKQHFVKLVDSEPVPFQVRSTRREIVQMFMYGAGLLHATSNRGDDKKLTDLITACGRHNAVAIFNHCLWDFLTVAVQVYHVIQQDYNHWLADHQLEGPRRDDIGTLFQSKTE